MSGRWLRKLPLCGCRRFVGNGQEMDIVSIPHNRKTSFQKKMKFPLVLQRTDEHHPRFRGNDFIINFDIVALLGDQHNITVYFFVDSEPLGQNNFRHFVRFVTFFHKSFPPKTLFFQNRYGFDLHLYTFFFQNQVFFGILPKIQHFVQKNIEKIIEMIIK